MLARDGEWAADRVRALFQITPPYGLAASGVFAWLGIVIVLAGFASFVPAWNASRLTVREVLAYE